MLIKSPYRWDIKPPLGSELDLDHPQAAGLKLCYLFNENAGPPNDLRVSQKVTIVGVPTWSPTIGGMGRGGYSATDYDEVDYATSIASASTYWFAVLGTVATSGDFQVGFGIRPSTGSQEYSILVGSSGDPQGYTNFGSGTAYLNPGSPIITDGKLHMLAFTITPTTINLWCDGKIISTVSGTYTGLSAVSYATIGLQHDAGLSRWPWTGKIVSVFGGNGTIPDMAWLAREPYAFIQAPSNRRLVSFSGGSATIAPSGIGSLESWGAAALGAATSIAPTAIGSLENWRTAVLSVAALITPVGLPSLENWGTSALSVSTSIAPAGISTTESWGTSTLGVVTSVAPVGISSLELWGTSVLGASATVAVPVITSVESWGASVLSALAQIAPSAIVTGESWGASVVSTSSAVIIVPLGIGSAESWGASFLGASTSIVPSAITTAEAWGSTVVSTSATAIIAPLAIGSGEFWGIGALSVSATVAPNAIASLESWGVSVLSTSSAAVIAPLAIASAEAWGIAATNVSTVIRPVGIASAESWGSIVVASPDVDLIDPTSPYRDADIYQDIIQRLEDTGLFPEITGFEENRLSADVDYIITIIPGEVREVDIFDPTEIERHGTYKIEISVNDNDPTIRWRKLDQLANIVRNTINGVSLASVTFPQLTMIRRSDNPKLTHPAQVMVLIGEWTYFVQGFDAFNVDD